MEFRLGGYECPGCGRLILPPELMPPTAPAPAMPASAHPADITPLAADPGRKPTTAAVPRGYPYPLSPPASSAVRPVVPPAPPWAGLPAGLLPLPASSLLFPSQPGSNNSGRNELEPLPPAAMRYTMASMLPLGIFSFYCNDLWMGILGVVGTFVPVLGLIYWAYIGAEGRKRAWRLRRFGSVAEFDKVMEAWSVAGLLVTQIGGLIAIIIAWNVAQHYAAYLQSLINTG
jgi:hypothetical protein